MSTHAGSAGLHLVVGLVLTLAGVVILRYPEASYAVRTAWKHDDPSLSSSGRTDQRVMGAVIGLIGIGLCLQGLL